MTTTPTTGSATSNKRRRGGSTATGTTLAAITSPKPTAAENLLSTLSSRLEPIKGLLVSQPDELKGYIISKLTEMLDLRVTIKQREKSYARFDKPLTDATTGAVRHNEAGDPLPFIPNSLRSKCPIKASKQTENDTAMKKLLEDAATVNAVYQVEMTKLAKCAGKLEITLRETKLRHLLFEFVETVALAQLVVASVKGQTCGTALTRDESKMKACYDVLNEASVRNARAVAMDTGVKLAEDYVTFRSFNNQAIESKMVEVDNEVLKAIINKMNTWLPEFSVNLWQHEDDKDQRREIDATIREALKPSAMLAANEEVEAAMDVEDASAPSQSVIEYIRKEQKKGMDKQMQLLKKQMRLNCSGDVKTKTPKPTNNGRNSEKNSTASSTKANSNKSKKSKKSKDGPKKDEKADPKKKKEDAATPSRKKQPRANRRSREESGGGGKRGSAGGR